MKISERITGTVENWATAWGDRLRNWMASWLLKGVENTFETFEPETREQAKAMLEELRDNPNLPASYKPIVNKLLEEKHPVWLLPLLFTVGGMLGGMLLGQMMPFITKIRYAAARAAEDYRLDPSTLAGIWLRDKERYKEFWDDLKDQGWDDDRIDIAKELAEIRLDPSTITAIWLRDKAKWEHLWKDLSDSGVNKERIEVFQELAHIIPPLADMVRFADFGSFDPEVIAKWRAFYDAPNWIREPMSLIGITGDWANKYWFSHWRQPGRFELSELHRRELIDDDIVKKAYLTQGYSSFWQDKLLELVKEPWTRVDVRRMWDMRTINEEELRKAYHALGYYDEWLEGMVLWTKVYVAFPDLIARWKNGWITEDDVRSELTGLGMPADRVDEMIETKIKPAKPERTTKERDLTKSEIVKGVKKGVIDEKQGWELLQDMGYDENEAAFILTINVAALEGSPDTYSEFKQITQLYRKAEGLEAKMLPKELIEAGKEYKEAKVEYDRALAEGITGEKLAPFAQTLAGAEHRYRELLTTYMQQQS